ncbi:hypothetical protein CBL_20527 [Carabus blaptoides fortunei]
MLRGPAVSVLMSLRDTERMNLECLRKALSLRLLIRRVRAASMEETNITARLEAIEKHLQKLAVADSTANQSYRHGRDSNPRRCWTCEVGKRSINAHRGCGAVTKGTVPEVIHIQALHSSDNGLLAEGEADGVRCRMVVDTGANVTLVHPKIIKLAQPPRSQGQPVGNIEDDVILGFDFLRRYRCVIDPVNNLLRIGHEDVMLENRNQNDHMRCQLICASTHEIPPMTEILVPVFCATSSSKKLMIVEPQLSNGCTPGLIVARAVKHVDNQETALRIMNVATTPRMISKNIVLAFCEPVGAVGLTGCHEDNCNSLKYSQIPSHLQELFLRASEHLQGDQQEKLRSLLLHFQDIFL